MRISGKRWKWKVCFCMIFFLSYHAVSVFAQTCQGPTVRPYVNISTNTTTICSGTEVKFVATAFNSGAHPSYQWKVNNVNAGNNTDTFVTRSLHNGDIVNCVVTADPLFACALPKTVSSYGIVTNVSAAASPSINITASANDICPGTQVTFTADALNINSSATFQWKLNNDSTGTSEPIYSNSDLKDGDEIFCLVIDSSSCYIGPVKSNVIVVSLRQLPAVTIDPADTLVKKGSVVKLNATFDNNDISNFEWQLPGSVTDPHSSSTFTKPIISATNYFFKAVGNNGCSISKKITIGILFDFIMPSGFTPNGDGRNDVFRIPANTDIRLEEFSIFDRWGNKIFSTTNSSLGWDGNANGIKQNAGVYIWVIKGSGSKGKITASGSFVLIR